MLERLVALTPRPRSRPAAGTRALLVGVLQQAIADLGELIGEQTGA